MDAKVTWTKKLSFVGTADTGFSVPVGTASEQGGDDDGFKPLELLAVGLAGCTAMDVISILEKKLQKVTAFEVKVHTDRVEAHPRIFKNLVVEYVVTGYQIDLAAIERAVELSMTKYCSASAMLRKAVDIEHKITLIEAK